MTDVKLIQSHCQAKFLTTAKFLIYSCMSVASFVKAKEQILATKILMSAGKI